jgi:2-polyprenyl-3-methyl-5-hydroxy-6-metoxy-1,4-benzoquinol methylase
VKIDKETIEYYESSVAVQLLSSWYNETRETEFIRHIVKYIPKNLTTLVDVGAGSGMHSHIFRKFGIKAVALDYSQSLTKFANEHFQLPSIRGDALHLPCNPRKLDIIFSLGVSTIVRHVELRVQTFQEMYCTVKRGGYVILSTPSDRHILFRIKKHKLHHLDVQDCALLEEIGFCVLHVLYWGIMPRKIWNVRFLQRIVKFLDSFIGRIPLLGLRKVVICQKL